MTAVTMFTNIILTKHHHHHHPRAKVEIKNSPIDRYQKMGARCRYKGFGSCSINYAGMQWGGGGFLLFKGWPNFDDGGGH